MSSGIEMGAVDTSGEPIYTDRDFTKQYELFDDDAGTEASAFSAGSSARAWLRKKGSSAIVAEFDVELIEDPATITIHMSNEAMFGFKSGDYEFDVRLVEDGLVVPFIAVSPIEVVHSVTEVPDSEDVDD